MNIDAPFIPFPQDEGYPDEDQFDDSLEHAPDAGERTGEYPEDDASRQVRQLLLFRFD